MVSADLLPPWAVLSWHSAGGTAGSTEKADPLLLGFTTQWPWLQDMRDIILPQSAGKQIARPARPDQVGQKRPLSRGQQNTAVIFVICHGRQGEGLSVG